MSYTDFDILVERMGTFQPPAFIEFDEAVQEPLTRWLLDFGLSQQQIIAETPRYLLELGILVVVRRLEIEPGRVLLWLRKQTRSLAVPQWQKDEEIAASPTAVTARRLQSSTAKLNGSKAAYDSISRTLGVPTGWLRRRHRKLQIGLGPRSRGQSEVPVEAQAITTLAA